MAERWKDRLKAAVDADGRTPRAISKAAGCGPNYLGEVFGKAKVPSIDKLLMLSAELKVSATYILTGSEVSPESEEMLMILASLGPDERDTMLRLGRQLKAARH